MPEDALDGYLARYEAPIAAQARLALDELRAQLPGAVELVYDNYNALVIAFGASEKQSDIVLSIALYPRWITLFFLRGTTLPDPEGRLGGSGKTIRQLRLASAETLREAGVRALVAAARAQAPKPVDPRLPRRMVIKSVSGARRPRRPSGKARG